MFGSLKKETCPYCFEPFSLSGAPFRCTNVPEKCPPEVDAVLRDNWGTAYPVSRVIPSNGVRRSVRCSCRHESSQRLCPVCHADLPSRTGECENLIFALIGAKDSGKSHYIAVVIEELQRRVGPALGLLLTGANDTTLRRFAEKFKNPVYRDGTRIPPTRSGREETSFPLIFTMSLPKQGLFNHQKTVTLVFFDTAGEDLEDQNVMSRVNKYIYRADGLILLLDPLQLDSVRARLEGVVALPERNSDTAELLTRVSSLIRTGRHLRPGPIDTPIAVAFSKFDAIQSLVDKQMQLFAGANHTGGFDREDFEAVSGEMQSLLSQWEGEHLCHEVSNDYPRHGFFGLSALGFTPPPSGRMPRPLPRRVEDPFLWLLYTHGLLKPKKR